MVSKIAKKYCCEDISNIDNYDKQFQKRSLEEK